MIRWLANLFRRKPKPTRAEQLATADTEILPPVIVSAMDACRAVLEAVERDRVAHPAHVVSYDDIVARVWSDLPPAVRGADTAVNRAEFASTVRAAVRLYDEAALWMITPDD